MTFNKIVAMTAAALAICGLSRNASAQSVEDFYKGKTVTVMIGYGPGGTDDVWARLIAKHIGEHIPGKPTVAATNVPGAGSLLLDCCVLLNLVSALVSYALAGSQAFGELTGTAVTRIGLDHQVPIANAILTTENMEQAVARQTDKGVDAARVAVEMAQLLNQIG